MSTLCCGRHQCCTSSGIWKQQCVTLCILKQNFFWQIDVLESPAWKNVIVLQTVLEETRKRSTNNFKKLKEIMATRKDSFYVFVNEHHKYNFNHKFSSSFHYFIFYHYFFKGTHM